MKINQVKCLWFGKCGECCPNCCSDYTPLDDTREMMMYFSDLLDRADGYWEVVDEYNDGGSE